MSPPLPPPPLSNLNLPSLPDLFLTALSVCFLFTSSSKPNHHHLTTTRCPFLSFPLNPHRFLKIPAMSHSSTSSSSSNPNNNNLHHPPRRHSFASPQSLSDWLKPRVPSDSFASWGVKPGTKNVHNLWLELAEGETSLADSTPPVRTVHVVTVRVTGKDGSFLIESHQELSDGNLRKRGRPLSEKMKPGEDPESAAVRAVREELGSVVGSGDGVRIDPNSYEMRVEERNSDSYPGLPGCYVLHTLNAMVEGLPESDFCTFEVDEYGDFDEKSVADEAVSVKKHYWTWVGLKGEAMNLVSPNGVSSVDWVIESLATQNQPQLKWHKAYFNAPEGNEPLALDLGSMGKGQVWINGQSIGRYWMVYAKGTCDSCNYAGTYRPANCQLGCGQPTQRWYHVPRSWLKPTKNLIVVFEELGGNPWKISLVKRTVHTQPASESNSKN